MSDDERPEHFEAGDRYCEAVEHYVDRLEAENRRLYERLERYWVFQNGITQLMQVGGPTQLVAGADITELREEIWPGGVFQL